MIVMSREYVVSYVYILQFMHADLVMIEARPTTLSNSLNKYFL